jgi:putative ABC transport system permease protein
MTFRDFTHAIRSLRRSPGFTVTVIVTLALGVGASTAMFSVVNAVLLQPLPYKDPERLTLVWADMHARNVRNFLFSSADFMDLRKQANLFSDMEAVTTGTNIFPREDGVPEQVVIAAVTPHYIQMLGAHVIMGRDFNDADGTPPPPVPPGAPPAAAAPQNPNPVILSYEFWKRRYGGDPNIVGKLAGRNVVVGVMQPGFELLYPPGVNVQHKPDFWNCLRLVYDETQRNNVFLFPAGRLKPGVSLGQAQQQVDGVAARLKAGSTIKQTAGFAIRLESMQSDLVASARPAIITLMGASIFLLLIACANVANLFLVRAGLREREWAVRTALGGNRWQTVRLMIVESLLLAASGTVIGMGLTKLALAELLHLAPADLPRLENISLNPAVLLFSALAGLGTALLFGVAPALGASRSSVTAALRGGSRTGGLNSGGVLRTAVVVAEVALSFVLLVGSGLMFRSFLEMIRIDLGYDPSHILTFQVLGGPNGRGAGPQQKVLKQNIVKQLGAIPGVAGVTAAFPFPLTGQFSPIRWGLQDALADASKFKATDFEFVLPGYFETMKNRVLEGRVFTQADNMPGRTLVVVDDVLAAKAFPGRSAVGQRILVRVRTPEPEWVDIIGVVAHQRNDSPAVEGREQVYFTDEFAGNLAANRFAVRVAGDPGAVAQSIRAELRRIDSTTGMFEVSPMTELVDKAGQQTRFTLLLIVTFASVAILLAGVGLYGVLSTVVRARTAEIGVRMALGAAPAGVFRLVVGRGLRLSLIGLVVGVAAAVGLTRVLTSMLVGVKPTDPPTFGLMAVLFLLLSVIACWLPAHRAANLQPTDALRNE